MKSDNVFRFVAIRPPPAQKKITGLAGDNNTTTEVDELIKKKTEANRLSPEQARLAAGTELTKSDRYFSRTEWGRMLISNTGEARALLQRMEQEADWESFSKKALNLLAPVNGARNPLNSFLASDDYASFSQSLWLTFYATLLNPYERPQDRETVTTWLLLLHLLEADTQAMFKTRVQRLPHTRPAVPYTFFASAPVREESEQPAERREDPLKRRLADIQDQIAKLHDARSTLTDLFVAKLQEAERMHPAQEPVEPAEDFDKKRTPTAASAGSGVDLIQSAPWRIAQEDLNRYGECFRLARAMGMVPETSTLPDLINRLDSEIALLTAQIDSLAWRDELRLVGNSFVQVSRAHLYEQDTKEDQ